jgi:hypothetical protein
VRPHRCRASSRQPADSFVIEANNLYVIRQEVERGVECILLLAS